MRRSSSSKGASAAPSAPVNPVDEGRLQDADPGVGELKEPAELIPTMFLDFDGTLHVGRASMDEHRAIALDTGRPLFEFAPLLIDLLKPYPTVRLVLTTSWLITLTQEEVVALMPRELGERVVDTTQYVSSRLSHILNGTDRTYVIWKYAVGKRLKHWLAVDDRVLGAEQFGRVRGELIVHYLLLHPQRGLGEASALQRVGDWLAEVHS